MKCNLFYLLCYYVVVFEVNCKFLSLLNELDMKNPVIIGKKSDLNTRELFDESSSKANTPWRQHKRRRFKGLRDKL